MSILQYRTNFAGEQDTIPRLTRLNSNDTLAVVHGAGYMNPFVLSEGFSVYSTDFVFISASDGNDIAKPSIAADGEITLVSLL